MRVALILIATLIHTAATGPASADDWGHYENARFRYAIDVPPGFAQGPQSENGDGQQFRAGASRLLVWGGAIVENDFESAAAAAIRSVEADGWALTYRSVTPSWASYSGVQGQRVLYERMVAVCDGQYAAFRLQYSAVDMGELDPIVNRLARSLKGSC